MRKQLMLALERMPLLGPLFLRIERRLYIRHVLRLRREAGYYYSQHYGNAVRHGPFSGMKLHGSVSWGADQYTVLSGQYEKELYPYISRAATASYEAFIDIGCANGFYAVGFALLDAECDVVAYDIDHAARDTTRLNASLNDVAARITIKERADHAELEAVLSNYRSAFILCDIEGAEGGLIDPDKCPALRRCDFLIELHNDVNAISALIQARFSQTHKATIISREHRNPFAEDAPPCELEDDAWVCVSEGRHFDKDVWLLLERKAGDEVQSVADERVLELNRAG